MAIQFHPYFDPMGNPTPSEGCDPLLLSDRRTLPFNTYANTRLSAQQNLRYDTLVLAVDEAELRLREIASIMGIVAGDDDYPTAA